jgi:hypothetical protein
VLDYTNPKSIALSDAAAHIIEQRVDILIDELLKTKKLRPA